MTVDGLSGAVTSPSWRQLRDVAAYQVTEIPRVHSADEDLPDESDQGCAQRIAALAAAYHAGIADGGPEDRTTAPARGLVAFCWVRTAVGGPVHIVTAGATLTGSATTGSDGEGGGVLLSLPGGARATVLRPGALDALIGGLACWRELSGISDGLLTSAGDRPGHGGQGAQGARHNAPSLDEVLLASWTGPFGWIVMAEPLRSQALLSLADEVAGRQRLAEAAADRFPGRAAQARRLAERHAELQRGVSAGFWRIRAFAGGCDEASAARVAGLCCASVPLAGLPYSLSPAPPAPPEPPAPAGPPGKPDPAEAGHPGGDAIPASPFCGSTELLAALARPPRSEVPGIRLALRPEFDITHEVGGPAIRLGEILDRNRMPAGPFVLPMESLNRHVFVCGATGAGKSQTVRSLLEAAAGRHIPWLVIEPAKAEYRLMANRLADGGVVRIRLGEADAVAAGLNPLEPAVGARGARFPLQTHADLVKALFIASFRSEEPFPQVLSAALIRVYEEAGWDLALGEPARGAAVYPALTDLQRAAERVVGEIGYSQRVTDDVLGFIRVRLASLRQGTTGRFLEGGHQIDFGKLLRQNVVLEIEDVGDDADKAFLMGAVLIRLAEHLRLAHRAPGSPRADGIALRHLTVIEEAHRLLRRQEGAGAGGSGAAGHAVEMFAGLLAEIRAYGEGLVIAEQIPARLSSDAIKNTAVKITHRLPAADDREAVGATMNATAGQSRYLVTLPPGQAAVFTDGMDFPVLVKIQDGTEREVASVPRTADARTVVNPRSASCGGECANRPCTLREMRGGQRALEEFPWIPMWAELTVLAHLSGWPMPVPMPDRLAEFRALPARMRQCALAQAVDTAVAARATVLGSPAGPPALAAHACAAIGARADRDQWLCPAEEPRWRLAGPVTEIAAFGAARPSVIETAGPLPELLGAFVDCRWPPTYLRRSQPGPPPASPSAAQADSPDASGTRTPYGSP